MADDDQPCFQCDTVIPESILCDSCNNWWCIRCINARCNGSLPDELYEALRTFGRHFSWDCPDCNRLTLPQQLLIEGVFSRDELLTTYQCNPLSLQTSAHRSRQESPATPRGLTQRQCNSSISPLCYDIPPVSRNPYVTPGRNSPYVPNQHDSSIVHNPAITSQVRSPSQARSPLHAEDQESERFTQRPGQEGDKGTRSQAQLSEETFHEQWENDLIRLENLRHVPSFNQPGSSTSTTPQEDPQQPLLRVIMGLLETLEANRREDRERFELQRQSDMMRTEMLLDRLSPRRRNSARERGGNDLGTSTGEEPNVALHVAKLPKIQLPVFSGNILDWPNFWDSFRTNIHEHPHLKVKQKFDYLHQSLKGTAKDKIKGLGLQGENYDEAIKILTKEYGQEQLLRDEAWRVLRELAPVKENLSNLEAFIDEVRATTTSLIRMNVPQAAVDCFVTSTLVAKLPHRVQGKLREMRAYKGTSTKDWLITEFIDALIDIKDMQVTPLQNAAVKPKINQIPSPLFSKQQPPPSAVFAQSTQARMCAFCGKTGHYSDQCKTIAETSKRRESARKKAYCFNCLNIGHRAQQCTKKKACYYCKGFGHHSSLCLQRQPDTFPTTAQFTTDLQSKEKEYSEEEYSEKSETQQVHIATSAEKDGIIMATMHLQAINPQTGATAPVGIYFDSGARHTCIEKKIAQQLGLVPTKKVTLDTARFNSSKTEKITSQVVELQIKAKNGFSMKINAYAIPNMTPPLPVYPANLSNGTRQRIRRYKLLNPPSLTEQAIRIDILLGMDYWYSVMGPKVSTMIPLDGDLVVHTTPFGNVLAGNTLHTTGSPTEIHPSFFCLQSQLTADVPKLWQLDTIGIKESKDGPAEEAVSRYYKETTYYSNGRYYVRWPWQTTEPELPSNFKVARYRLHRTLNTLATATGENTQLIDEYNAIILDQLQKGVIEPIAIDPEQESRCEEFDQAIPTLKHYISHFPRIKRDRTTTKVRIVYDASAKTRSKHKSLNDLMYTGINYLEDLTGLLIRFRLPAIAMISDIEKAFLQVGLNPKDRDCVRFLWVRDHTKPATNDNLQAYRFTRTPFGVVASPYLLGATINHHLDLHPGPLTDAIRGNIYMDNIFTGAENATEGVKTYQLTKRLFQVAGMNVREWLTNNDEVNKVIRKEDLMQETKTKVLGILWDASNDIVYLAFKPVQDKPCTKRQALHLTATVFDPLGLMSPITIKAKINLQDLWRQNYDWDTKLSPKECLAWEKVGKEFNRLPEIQLPRRILSTAEAPTQLVCFTDASPEAYAAAIYLRQASTSKVICNLIFAKARVAPINKTTTIPRLELLGVLIGTRALAFVEKQLRRQVEFTQLWTDSQIVLCWLQSNKHLEPYISRRIEEIREISKNINLTFQYISTKDNPTDIATRGASVDTLLRSHWFCGPPWLKDHPSLWPKWETQSLSQSIGKDDIHAPTFNPKTVSLAVSATTSETKRQDQPQPFVRVEDFSSLTKLLKVTSYVLRFISALRRRQIPQVLNPTKEEMDKALIFWVKRIQQTHFKDDITSLERNKPTKFARQMDLFLDDDLLRCGGRLANAPLSESSKFPMILPKNCHFTNLVIFNIHQNLLHSGVSHTLVELRTQFWIPSGRSQVKKALTRCLICRKVEGGPFKPPRMAPLPAERLEGSPTFQHTGLDYLGPLLVKPFKGGPYQNRWVALFTCFTTRAIHLELIPNCTAEAALNAIRRFVARRGLPATVLTDNAPQFGKCANFLTQLFEESSPAEWEKLTTFFAEHRINWKFIPENSPWVGGFYERLVGLVKRALRKTLWKNVVDDDDLNTLLVSIEGLLNTRPLTAPDNDDFPSQKPLTPADFLAPNRSLGFCPSEDPSDPEYLPHPTDRKGLKERWLNIRKKLDTFWKRWQSQYLQELRESQRIYFKTIKKEVCRGPVCGEVVLLKDRTPRMTWKIGKIITLFPSPSDKQVRFVEVMLPGGQTTRRGIKDLIPLEYHIA